VKTSYAFKSLRLCALVYDIQQPEGNGILQMFISLAISSYAPFMNLSSIIGLYRVQYQCKRNKDNAKINGGIAEWLDDSPLF
jgi:hypothetical protein